MYSLLYLAASSTHKRARACMCMCVCVCMREKERGGECGMLSTASISPFGSGITLSVYRAEDWELN